MDWQGPPLERVDWDAVLRDLAASPLPRAAPRALPLEALETIDWDAAVSAALGITDPVGQIANIIWGWVDSVLKKFGEMLGKALEPVAGTLGKAWDFLRENVPKIGDWIKEATNVLQGIGAAFAGFSNAILQLPQLLWQALPDWLKNFFTGLADFFTKTVPEFFGKTLPEFFAKTLPETFRTVADFFARTLPDMFRTIADFFTKTLPGALGAIADFFTKTLPQVLGTVGDFFTKTLPELFTKTLPAFFADLGARISGAFSAVADFFTRALPGAVTQAFGAIADFFTKTVPELFTRTLPSALADIVSRIGGALAPVVDFFTKTVPDFFTRVLPGAVTQAFGAIADFFTRAVPEFFTRTLPAFFTELGARLAGALGAVADFFTKAVPDFFTRVLPGFFVDLGQKLAGALGTVADFFTRVVPGALKGFADAIMGAFGAAAKFFTEILPGAFGGFVNAIVGFFTQTLPRVFTVDIPGFFQMLAEKLGAVMGALAAVPGAVTGAINALKGAFEELGKALPQLPQMVVDAVARAFMLPPEVQEKVKAWLQRCSRDPPGCLLALAGKLLRRATEWLKSALETAWKHIVDALKWVWERIMEGAGALAGAFMNAITGFWQAVSKALLDVALAVFKWAAGAAASVVKGVKEILGIKNPAGNPDGQEGAEEDAFKVSPWWRGMPWAWTWEGRGPEVEFVFLDGLLKTRGMAHQMWAIGGELLGIYWLGTLMPLVLRSLAKLLEGFTFRFEFAPELRLPWILGAATKWQAEIRINAAELFHALGEGFGSFAHAFAIGTSFAVAQLFLANLQHLYVPRIMLFYEKYADKIIGAAAREHGIQSAIYSFMVRVPLASEMVEWARRWIAAIRVPQVSKEVKAIVEGVPERYRALKTEQVLDTLKLHLTYLGLPKWYSEFLAQDPDKFVITFKDRFGKDRKLSLSPLYELPTHSELARMTQRDIFPGVDVMKAVGWVRGWNEDLTTMIYLLTFRYPSFEKLWTFYMRALSGMLWFKAPPVAETIFKKEADQVGAGKPVSPLDLQKALGAGEEAAARVKAMETALNVYLKWIEYSNFSWFTESTEMYGIPVGREIVGTLGGWVADSWLMWDVAADIPTKIDMRWMSRYGIFQLMADRFRGAGVTFESYAPLVEAVPKLMDGQPASQIQVDLTWFSKLLQATGLHPAWVPVVTVAENIMAIADEMTLLRTGWINLFKEGLLTHDAMERSLAGLFVASYKVGYWDPERKAWTSGWINLPVRWLPHERKLLEYRALIDRVMDLYREFYGYMRSAVRSMVLTPEEARKALADFVEELDGHYSKVAKEITGYEVHLKHDEEYLKLWLDMFAQLGRFEAMERGRMWWQRVSGWLLYRVAQGYVDPKRVEEMLQKLRELLKLTDIEIKAYAEIVKTVFDIIQRERVPTPWQVATLAEYVDVPAELVAKSVETYGVPEEFRPLLMQYARLRPVKADYRAVINAAVRARRYGAISDAELDAIIEGARAYGFTEREIALLKMRAELEHAIDEVRQHGRMRPLTPWQLAALAEYVDVPADLVGKAIAEYGVPQDYAPLVARYIALRPVKADYRAVINAAIRAFRLGALPREQLDAIIGAARDYGFTDREIALLRLRADLEELAAAAREYVPTPAQLAAMAEHVPLVKQYAAQALAARRVTGVWAGAWLAYIHARTLADDLRAWARAALALVENLVADDTLLGAVLESLKAVGYEDAELALLRQTVMLNAARRAWNELLGRVGELSRMSRYAPAAADLAWRRLEAAINALPADDATKNLIKTMWHQFIAHYQNYPEVRAYIGELVAAYAYGAIGDAELDRELQQLRELGVPEITLALARRRAWLRRLRVMAARRR